MESSPRVGMGQTLARHGCHGPTALALSRLDPLSAAGDRCARSRERRSGQANGT
jgi:hypothetical protein